MSIDGLYQKGKVNTRRFTFLVIYLFGKLLDDAKMTREEIRRQNARELARAAGGQTEFGRMVDMEGPQVSQIIGKNPIKNIGNSIAKRIEIAFSKPEGWLDQPHTMQLVGDEPAIDPEAAPEPNQFSVSEVVSKVNAMVALNLIDQTEAAILIGYRVSSTDGKGQIAHIAEISERDTLFIVNDQAKS
jgi:hypothetical protein